MKVLGVLALDDCGGRPLPPAALQKRRLGLLAILAIAGSRGGTRERIQAWLWPESSSAHSRHALDQLVYATRQALRANPFLSSGGNLRLDPDVITSDVAGFDDAMARGAWADAVALYGGPLLDGVHFADAGDLDEWIERERMRHQLDYQRALESLAHSAAAESPSSAVAWWRTLAASDPLSARVAIETIRALASAGEPAAAIQHGHRYQRLVRAELGVEPDHAVEQLITSLAAKVAVAKTESTQAKKQQARLTSVAVLPFLFLDDVDNSRALALGFADALITIIGTLEDVAVSPTSAIVNCGADTEPAKLCRDLDVGHAVQGTVQRMGSRWRVSIQLFDAAAERIILSEKHDFTLDSIFEVQDALGRRVVESLQRRFPSALAKSRDRYTQDREAYGEYMTGMRESVAGHADGLRSAAAHLTAAIERDPRFALAHAALSSVAMDLHFSFDPQRIWLNIAEDHCRQALALDPALPEAHLARAWILWSPAKNFQHMEAIAALEQVLATHPNIERAHNRMSGICGHIGRLPEARLAHERARCVNPRTRSGNLEWNHIYSGEFALAEEAVELWYRERPDNMYALYTRIIPPLATGALDVAAERLDAALGRVPGDPLIASLQGMLHALRHESEAALACVRSALDSPRSFGHTHHTYYQVASVHAILGDTHSAMGWLERSVDSGFACWPYFRVDPHLARLRGTSAFAQLVADLERTYGSFEIARL